LPAHLSKQRISIKQPWCRFRIWHISQNPKHFQSASKALVMQWMFLIKSFLNWLIGFKFNPILWTYIWCGMPVLQCNTTLSEMSLYVFIFILVLGRRIYFYYLFYMFSLGLFNLCILQINILFFPFLPIHHLFELRAICCFYNGYCAIVTLIKLMYKMYQT
jgi:hypothetical protein